MNVILRAAQRLTTPLLPDDYLGLVDPLWVTTSLRARIVAIHRETATSASLELRPSTRLRPHLPGQHIRLGADIDGVRHWRSYSITSAAPTAMSGRGETITVTVQRQPDGLVSGHLIEQARPGDIVQLEGPQGDFHLPLDPPSQLLLIGAGSGITPLMGMIRTLYPGVTGSTRTTGVPGVTGVTGSTRTTRTTRTTSSHTWRRPRTPIRVHLIYSARDRGRRIFADELTALVARTDSLSVHIRDTARQGRLSQADLESMVPTWRQLPTWACGPTMMLDELTAHWQHHGIARNLSIERFQPMRAVEGDIGGRVTFSASGKTRTVERGETLLAAGEAAGILMPHGCRMGICHNCVLPLESGQVQDIRTGEIHGEPGDVVQTCISRPASDLSLRA